MWLGVPVSPVSVRVQLFVTWRTVLFTSAWDKGCGWNQITIQLHNPKDIWFFMEVNKNPDGSWTPVLCVEFSPYVWNFLPMSGIPCTQEFWKSSPEGLENLRFSLGTQSYKARHGSYTSNNVLNASHKSPWALWGPPRTVRLYHSSFTSHLKRQLQSISKGRSPSGTLIGVANGTVLMVQAKSYHLLDDHSLFGLL